MTSLSSLFLISRLPRSPMFTLFPYTTLFRSGGVSGWQGRPLRVQGRHPAVLHTRAVDRRHARRRAERQLGDRKSTRLNSSHLVISYAVFCLKKKKIQTLTR